jgi:hypothetical protein
MSRGIHICTGGLRQTKLTYRTIIMAKLILADYDFNSASRILNLPNAVNDQEPATFAQLKSRIEGLAWKDSVRAQTQANLSLASPGGTIDGVTLATSDRVLVSSQTTTSENGIYIWNGAAVPMTRALDASTFDELESAVVTVDEGTVGAGTTWRQTAVNGTIDSSAVTWVTFGVAVPLASTTTAGRVRLATQAETDTGTDATIAITPATLTGWSGAPKRYQTNIGDGNNTSYTVTHNLNTRDAMVKVYRNSGNYDEVGVEVRNSTVNTITIVFATAPTSNQFRVVVVA